MPAPRTADRRFLERHGNKWRVVVSVPRDLQEAMGRTKLKQSLPTDSLAEARPIPCSPRHQGGAGAGKGRPDGRGRREVDWD